MASSSCSILSPSSHLIPCSSSLPRLLHRNFRPLHRQRRRLSITSASVSQDSITWTAAPLSLVAPIDPDATLFHVSVDLSGSPALAASYSVPGQYIQLRFPSAPKPVYLAMASTPSFAADVGEFQFLVSKVPGTTAGLLCELERGEVVEVTVAEGRGFQIDKISPPDAFPVVLMFATGTGVAPIRALIESGFDASKRSDVRLYYGARNLKQLVYQDRFKEWESAGVKTIPVLSQPDGEWGGETGYIQDAFSRNKQLGSPSSTGAILCGDGQMVKEVKAVLIADGVAEDKILTNY